MTDDVNDILKQSLLLLLGLVVVVDGACCIILMGLGILGWCGPATGLEFILVSTAPFKSHTKCSYEIGIPTQES